MAGPAALDHDRGGAAHALFEQFVEPVKQHWKDVGIYLDIEVVERSLAITRGGANETQLSPGTTMARSIPGPFRFTWCG